MKSKLYTQSVDVTLSNIDCKMECGILLRFFLKCIFI